MILIVNHFMKIEPKGVNLLALILYFNYFLIRVDMGIKLKDPARLENNGWLDIANFTWRNHEFDKYNDQGDLISAKRNNYAIQLGLGLPF